MARDFGYQDNPEDGAPALEIMDSPANEFEVEFLRSADFLAEHFIHFVEMRDGSRQERLAKGPYLIVYFIGDLHAV